MLEISPEKEKVEVTGVPDPDAFVPVEFGAGGGRAERPPGGNHHSQRQGKLDQQDGSTGLLPIIW
jgi:hypothetical protein